MLEKLYNIFKLNKSEKFWLEDLRELYVDSNWKKIVPLKGMTRVEQYNSVTRLLLYFIIAVLLLGKKTELVQIPVFIIIAIVLLYLYNKNNNNDNDNDITSNIVKKPVKKVRFDDNKNIFINNNNKFINNPVTDVTSLGSLRSHNSYDTGSSYNSFISDVNSVSLDSSNSCRIPTYNNPMMNPNLNDYNIADPPAACNADDEEINDNMQLQFNKDLYMTTNDLWEKENSQRQFYSVPNTAVPNNQVEFAKWLYQDGPTCKEDSSQCFRQTELRRNNRQLNPF